MENTIITEDIVVSCSICQRKSYQIIYKKQEYEQPYSVFLKEKIRETKKVYLQSHKEHTEFELDSLIGGSEVILNAKLISGNLKVNEIDLLRIDEQSKFGTYSYIPLIFLGSNNINTTDRIKASYVSEVLHHVQGKKPNKIMFVLNNGSQKQVKNNKDYHSLIVSILEKCIINSLKVPSIIFIAHCEICPFKKYCLMEARDKDSISLLGNMTAKVIKKFESKGIFTITQLSYLYKPRRRSRYWKEHKPIHKHELQALALRTKEIYTDMLLSISKEEIEIFIDFESIPDDKFYYLIGIYVKNSTNDYHYSLWADKKSDEQTIWNKFTDIIRNEPNATIFHYGSYEKKAINLLGNRYKNNINDILERLCNVNEYIFGRIYFPTYTNKLKEIGGYLGFRWTAKNASGLNSITWRLSYEKTHNAKIKRQLITYNQEDCINLSKIKEVIYKISTKEPILTHVRAIDDSKQCLNHSSDKLVKEFDKLVKSAHGKYEENKIAFKNKNKKSKSINNSKRSNLNKIPKYKINKVVRVPRGRICPVHKRKLIYTNSISEIVIIDLVCTTKEIKRVITKYWGYKGRCPNCSHRHSPPSIRNFQKHATKYGYGLRAWIAYQRLAMRLPFRKISQLLEDTFNIKIKSGGISHLFRSITTDHIKTEKNLLKSMLNSKKIHADETLVNIHGKMQYVWVFTDGLHVVFKLTPTRGSSIVHEVLNGYNGVLISDFFAGYDSINCQQQKCWVHFIRDINEDLRKYPFDLEFESFVISLRNILIPIFNSIEKYGSKKRHTNRYIKTVDKYYKLHIDNVFYDSENAKKYQKRLSRYRGSLFTFLEHDNIPWNNNMAERALRHLAVQRKISGSFFESGMKDYLVLLGIMQSCRFQNKSLLEFLMSSQNDIDEFKGKKNITGWVMD